MTEKMTMARFCLAALSASAVALGLVHLALGGWLAGAGGIAGGCALAYVWRPRT